MFGKLKKSAQNFRKEGEAMRVIQLLIYSTFAFMFFILVSVSFFDILHPIPDTETRTVKKINESIYRLYLQDYVVAGKFYNDDGYFLVVYNEKSKDFDIKEVEEEYWKNQQIGQFY